MPISLLGCDEPPHSLLLILGPAPAPPQNRARGHPGFQEPGRFWRAHCVQVLRRAKDNDGSRTQSASPPHPRRARRFRPRRTRLAEAPGSQHGKCLQGKAQGEPLLRAVQRRHPRPRFAARSRLSWNATGFRRQLKADGKKENTLPTHRDFWASNDALILVTDDCRFLACSSYPCPSSAAPLSYSSCLQISSPPPPES